VRKTRFDLDGGGGGDC